MRTVTWLAVALAAGLAWPPEETQALSRRKECRQACGAAIETCVAGGGKRRRCKRQTLRRCRREGVETCAVATTTTTTSPGGTTTSNPGATTTTPGATTTSTTLGSVHGCTAAAAADRRDPAASRTVTFTFTEYSPKCIRIAAGQSVTFSGSFLSHPLVGGEVVNGTKTPDPTSPIPTTTSGTMRAVSFPAGGVFSYYCDVHALSPFDMVGAVFVDP